MMKNNLFIVIALVTVFVFTGFKAGQEPCSARDLKEKTKDLLDPYKYDSSELTRIQYKNKETLKEVEVPLFIGETYRLVFNTEALPRPVEINVYNKDKEAKNRKLLFSSKGSPAATKQFTFEHSKARRVFIDYIIPKDSLNSAGCVVFMLGYK